MNIDPPSFLIGFGVAAGLACAWQMGQQSAYRHARRIWRHGRNLDHVFFEDAERDPSVDGPKPSQADVHPIAARLP